MAALVTVSSPLLAQLAVSNTSLPFGGLNQNYTAALTATGGTGNYGFALTGNVPPGLFYNNESGTIQGSPTKVGTFSFTVTVTDFGNNNKQASKQLSIGVMQISSAPQLPSANTCSFYSQALAVSDGPPPPFNWSFDDSPAPPGLAIDPTSGVISGTPTGSGQFTFTIEAFSPSANIFATQVFSLTIGSLCFVTTTVPNGAVNSFYRESLVITGGTAPLAFSVTGGSLPTGVSLDPKSGLLSGTPTVPGPFNFTIEVKDSADNVATQSFSVTILAQLAFTTTSPLPAGKAGTNYSVTFAATGGMAPYTFNTQDAPAGLQLSSAGVLSGTPSAGTFTLTVVVSDSLHNQLSMDFKVTFGSAGPVLLVTPSALTFSAVFQGDSPPPQFIDVTPVGTQPINFTVQVDGGAGVPAPGWITVTPGAATAPSRLVVRVNQGTLAAATSTARVQVIDNSGTPTIVMVTLNIATAAPQLQVTPDTLHFAARAGAPGTLVETLGVRSIGGGGPISFSTFVQDNSSWITGVTPASSTTVFNSTVFVKVQVNTQGLQQGSYHDVILFASNAATISVPVALFVSGSGAILDLSVTGIRFQARSGGGFSNPQTVQILDVGDPGSSFEWNATLTRGSQYFTLSASSGTSSVPTPGTVTIIPTASALQQPTGGYYALLKISSAQALNSPLYVVLVLDLEDPATPALPDPNPAGLVFIGPAGHAISATQNVNINTSSATAVPYTVSVLTGDGGNWLTVNPSTGTASGSTPGVITLSVDATQLSPGIYSAEADISMNGALRSVNITLIAQPAGSPVAGKAEKPRATGCAPSALALTEIGLVNNFSVPAGWPAALTVQLNDDCGNPVSNSSVTANFSNGDASLMLNGTQPGTYSATWQPGAVSSQMEVTIQAQSTTLKPAVAQLIGTINQNQNAPPVISENGTVNTFNRVPAGALAPGMIVEVYGSGLATTKGNPPGLPLQTAFGGTSIIVGPYQAPLYYVSGGQVNVQFDSELTPNQQYPVIAVLNGALSVPVMTDIAPIQLGVAALDNGLVIAQHGVGSAYVTEASPAKQNEVVVIYLSGMGATTPAVTSGEPAPGGPNLAKASVQPTVTLNGQAATVQFAGLTPGFVGLYQVNFVIPSNAGTGDLTLIVKQNNVSSNATRIPVSK